MTPMFQAHVLHEAVSGSFHQVSVVALISLFVPWAVWKVKEVTAPICVIWHLPHRDRLRRRPAVGPGQQRGRRNRTTAGNTPSHRPVGF